MEPLIFSEPIEATLSLSSVIKRTTGEKIARLDVNSIVGNYKIYGDKIKQAFSPDAYSLIFIEKKDELYLTVYLIKLITIDGKLEHFRGEPLHFSEPFKVELYLQSYPRKDVALQTEYGNVFYLRIIAGEKRCILQDEVFQEVFSSEAFSVLFNTKGKSIELLKEECNLYSVNGKYEIFNGIVIPKPKILKPIIQETKTQKIEIPPFREFYKPEITVDDSIEIMNEFKNILIMESKEYYPLVYIPGQIRNYVNNKSCFEVDDSLIRKEYSLEEPVKTMYAFPITKPIPPSMPADYKYESYEKYVKKEGFSNIYYWLFVFIFSLIFFIICIINDNNDFAAFLIFIIVVSALRTAYVFRKRRIKTTFQKNVQLTKDEKKIRMSEYCNRVSSYNQEISSYNFRLISEENEKKLNEKKLESYKIDYFQKKYSKQLYVTEHPVRSREAIQKGRSEDSFLRYLLKEEFANEISINMALNTHSSSFYPDFIYESRKYGFFIDIEIDEQYEIKTKVPIHYIGSEDEARNDYFLSKNWFVIRFAEKQIENHPKECSEYIKEVISRIERPYDYSSIIPTDIPKIKRWTYEEVYLDGNDNVRNR